MDRLISGIKPTGELTLGNYLGAIKPLASIQGDYETFVFVADLHALTIKQEPAALKKNSAVLASVLLASGIDPDKACVFKQSDILEHGTLEWILTCQTNLAELIKMPQFKNYKERHKGEPVPTGMAMYPSLMNADVLLYLPKFVLVGEDQLPHVELTRDVAERFNRNYGKTFEVPEPLLIGQGAKIMSLSDPTKKMSKSESDKGTIYLFDDEETIRRKFKKAVTDAEGKIRFDKKAKPGISNLLTIFACLSGKTVEEAEKDFQGTSDYGLLKDACAAAVWNELSMMQEKAREIEASGRLADMLEKGKAKAKAIAESTLSETYRKLGL